MASSSSTASPPGEITQLLKRLSGGDRAAESRLVPLVYAELRRLAARYMWRERRDHTLQPTALVHEAYLKLIEQRRVSWQSRTHFFCVAARLMRRILVDHAREVKASKRAGSRFRVPLGPDIAATGEQSGELLAIDQALERLLEQNPRQARIVELRFFGGCSEEEIAQMLGISVRTVKRDWSVARAWLYAELSKK
jgi:RNA polymerase sigma factor (TIGR02999 family)